MGELIAAGVKSGFGFWWPALRRNWPALLTLALVGELVVMARPTISLLPAAFAFPACIAELYSQAFELPTERYARSRRLLSAWALFCVFMGVVGLLFFVVLLCTLYAVASAGSSFDPKQVSTWAASIDARGRLVASAVFILGLLAMGWVAMRVWLASAATITENRIAMLSTWVYTRGRVVSMAITRALLTLPAALLILLFFVLLPKYDRSRGAGLVALLSLAPIFAFAWIPMQVGAAAEFYRRRVLPPEPAR